MQEPQLFPKQIGRYLVYLNLQGQIEIVVSEDVRDMTDDEAAGILEYLLTRAVLFNRVLPERAVHERNREPR